MSLTLDSRAFEVALRQRLNRLEKSSNDLPQRMTGDIAKKARSTVARRTGQTAASIKSRSTGKGSAEFESDNTYLEFGTSKMDAQPFVRPARNEVISAYRAGRYKPDL